MEPLQFLNDIVRGGERFFLQTRDRLLPLYPGLNRIDALVGDVLRLRRREPRYCLIEERLYFEDRFLADVWGTLDFGAFFDGDIIVSDLKFGRGHEVYPEHNEQQLIYAALFVDSLTRAERKRIKSIRIIIDQPRIPHAGGEWVIDYAYLERWIDKVLYPAIERIKAKKLEYRPGKEICFWCKAKLHCEAYREFTIKKLGIRFDDERSVRDLSIEGISELSPKRKAELLAHKSMVIDFLQLLEKDALAGVVRGDPLPGFKAVYGQHGNRQWQDDRAARRKLEEHLGSKATVITTVSPAQAEKLLPRRVWRSFEGMTKRGDPSPMLVPERDGRPAIPPITFKDER